MNKKQLLKHLREDVFCRIGRSKIHGVGVIAVREIPKNTNPFKRVADFELVKFTQKDLAKVHPEVKKMIDDFFSKKDKELLIPSIGLNAIDISFMMNQSEKPNVALGKNEDFFTTRNIKKGEELTVDYSTFSD